MSEEVVAVGVGLGGLFIALRLTTYEYQIEILKKFHQTGGRLNELKVMDDFTFDVGSSIFSMI